MKPKTGPSRIPTVPSAHHGGQLREEAAMAAITFNATPRKLHIQEQLKTVLAAFREMIDAFVSNRMRQAAAQAGHIRPRRPHRTPSINAQ
jgi:hypothetical protein